MKDEVKFAVHNLTNHLQVVLAHVEHGNLAKALLAVVDCSEELSKIIALIATSFLVDAQRDKKHREGQ